VHSTHQDKPRGLKADSNNANGGIGVTYSNVMLGGVDTLGDAGARVPASTYKNHFDPRQAHAEQLSPDLLNNQSHKNRFLNHQQVQVTGAPQSNNNIAYVKGIDFNSQQKYDYNILNNVPLAGVHQAPSPQNR
jgi:hypothetical protein